MEKIILVGHGSPKKDANNMNVVGKMLHNAIHPGCGKGCVMTSYLQFEPPDLPTTLGAALKSGADKIIVHPFFLSSGMHVTSDIPGIIDEFRARAPGVEFIYTEPLGVSQKLVSLITDRIAEAGGMKPLEIEAESFRALSEETDLSVWPEELHPIVKRVIHATADFSFNGSLIFHPDALRAGLRAIKAGKNILTDVGMVRTGINKRILGSWGGEAVCRIDDVVPEGDDTRAETAIAEALDESVGIVAIGNAPTALIKCVRMIQEGTRAAPDLVVGVPVGFVKAVESKALLASQDFPHITNAGRKGGTPVAVAIVNAILLIAGEGPGNG